MTSMEKCIDGISFTLKNDHDFDWLTSYGEVFAVFDQQDSGNLCFGVQSGNEKLFIKYAGAPTIHYKGSIEDAVAGLKHSISVYEDIQHPALIQLLEHAEYGSGYAAVYKWAEGESLHAHWNFDKYPKYTHPQSPNYRFEQLEMKHKLNCLQTIFSLHQTVAESGYVAIDFYDGSIMYDFNTHKTTICDIDFYHRAPYINTMGRMWGSSRFMSPEEFEQGAVIDEITNVFTMGATAYELLGSNRDRSLEEWKASPSLYEVAKRAVNADRSERYPSIKAFIAAWNEAICGIHT
ncbi:serine/threonine protein kinase [Paenibacillus marinisediminis]